MADRLYRHQSSDHEKKYIIYIVNSTRLFVVCAIIHLVVGLGSLYVGNLNTDADLLRTSLLNMVNLRPYFHPTNVPAGPSYYGGMAWPPVSLYLVAPVVLLEHWLHLPPPLFTLTHSALLLLTDILTIYLILAFVRLSQPHISSDLFNLITILLFFSGHFLHTSGFITHPESLLLLFFLGGIRYFQTHHFFRAGIFFGFAVCTQQTALLFLSPLFLVKPQRSLIVSFVLTCLVVMLPVLLVNPAETWDSLVANKFLLRVDGPNLWWLTKSAIHFFSPQVNIEPQLLILSNLSLFVAIFVAVFYLGPKTPLFNHLTIISLLFSILGYWIWFRYFLLLFVFLLLWETSARKTSPPYIWLGHSFLLITISFIGTPLWQLLLLLLNSGLLIYLLFPRLLPKQP